MSFEESKKGFEKIEKKLRGTWAQKSMESKYLKQDQTNALSNSYPDIHPDASLDFLSHDEEEQKESQI